jgi:cobalt ECF transporter T component CbiQ
MSGHLSLSSLLKVEDVALREEVHGLQAWDPRVKLLFTGAAVLLNVTLALPGVSAALLALALLGLLASRTPWRALLFFVLAPSWALLLVAVGFAVGFGHTPLWSLGPLTVYAEGLAQGGNAVLRVASEMSWMALLVLTTPFHDILGALRWFRVPEVLVSTLGFMYRYIFVLFGEFTAMRAAARVRGGFDGTRRGLETSGSLLAQIFFRAYDRSERIALAIQARGGELAEPAAMSHRAPDAAYADQLEPCPEDCDVTPEGAPTSGELLVCEDLHYSYEGDIEAVRGVGFAIQPGEAVALCGPNGSGKTTLLSLLTGLLRPERGSVRLRGEPLTPAAARRVHHSVGLLFQDSQDQLFSSFVGEDVAFGLRNLGLPEAQVKARVHEALALCEVEHLVHRPIHQLSGGEMKRVALAGILAMRPPLLILDEPTSGLDPAAAEHLERLLVHLNRDHGYAILVVSHQMERVPRLAQRVLVVADGRLLADGPVRSVLTDLPLLGRARLRAPSITRYFHERGVVGGDLPLTVKEALERAPPGSGGSEG